MPHIQHLSKEFETFRYRHDLYTVFEDFLECSAIAISNSINLLRFEEREKRYLQIAKKYTKDELNRFAKILAFLVNALDDHPDDYLGQLFVTLELGDKWKGQFFTPYNVAKLLADLTIRAELEKRLANGENIRINDCAVGGGVTLIAVFNTIKELGYNPQQVARFYASDIDRKAVFMTYIQLSLLGVNAQVFHMNTLTLEHYDTWLSPGYFFGHGYSGKKTSTKTLQEVQQSEQLTLF